MAADSHIFDILDFAALAADVQVRVRHGEDEAGAELLLLVLSYHGDGYNSGAGSDRGRPSTAHRAMACGERRAHELNRPKG